MYKKTIKFLVARRLQLLRPTGPPPLPPAPTQSTRNTFNGLLPDDRPVYQPVIEPLEIEKPNDDLDYEPPYWRCSVL